MTGKEFAAWMDGNGVTNQVAAELFGVSEQNIYNWRSTRGVPPSKAAWVSERMVDFTARKVGATTLERLSLEITREQFADWNRAALLAGKIIYDWAADALDAAAELDGTDPRGSGAPLDPLALVAEPGIPYRANSQIKDERKN